MKDTLESVSIKEPISLGDLGSIFWGMSHLTSKGSPPDEWQTPEDFFKFYANWVEHYAIPFGGGFSLTFKLNKPLRDNCFESARIFVDYLMSTIESVFTSEEGKLSLEELTLLPKELILRLKDLLLEFVGEELFCHYRCLFEGDDPREVSVEFVGCQKLTMEPDDLLTYIATRLSQVKR